MDEFEAMTRATKTIRNGSGKISFMIIKGHELNIIVGKEFFQGEYTYELDLEKKTIREAETGIIKNL